jgi:hypothetical protein
MNGISSFDNSGNKTCKNFKAKALSLTLISHKTSYPKALNTHQ